MKLNELEFHDLLSIAEFTPIKTSHPNAWIGHLPFAYWLIKLAKPKIFVELGTHTGNSYFGFCQSVRDNKMSTKCYAVHGAGMSMLDFMTIEFLRTSLDLMS